MASIQRIVSPLTNAVSYRAQVRLKGRPAQSETFPNRKEALQWAVDRDCNPRGPTLPARGRAAHELRATPGTLNTSSAPRIATMGWRTAKKIK